MPSPIETIAARVLAAHFHIPPFIGHGGTRGNGCSCGAVLTADHLTPLWLQWGEHRAHVAAEIARAIAEDEGLRNGLYLAADHADDKWQHGVGSGGYDPNGPPLWIADAVIDALTTNREDLTDE